MLIHSKHNLCQLCCCPDTGCKGMKKNVFDKNPPPSLSENDCLGVHHRGQNRYRDST